MQEMTDRKTIFDRNILASTHINFLFGAGVNGRALPQLSGFTRTIEELKKMKCYSEDGFESGIDNISTGEEREHIKQIFITEFKEYHDKAINDDCFGSNSSIQNIEFLLRRTYMLAQEAENRNPSMKQVNIYSLNYDTVVENVLMRLGYLTNEISASNTATKSGIINVIGFDYKSKKYIPTFMVSKLHGDIDKPIIPGREKYKDILNENYFEVAFNMKEQLCRQNSILIVIGYSGRDNHINMILGDCINAGLKIYWYKYSETDYVPFDVSSQVIVREQDDQANKIDTTRACYLDMGIAWEEKSGKL